MKVPGVAGVVGLSSEPPPPPLVHRRLSLNDLERVWVRCMLEAKKWGENLAALCLPEVALRRGDLRKAPRLF